ncbi:Cytochrome c oxidase subunit 6b-1 [Chondrus crispus]|uniref:Cytochrome c oxidase subunit 6b-1 n=1 Tax=Chondrus crispus TaxID=2769 RepID=R7QEE6_CHOCR|nr:Cytochrome c oxidase subunit 6b-1 [Chondrus crispus]CDF35826.1 Cytochrome c oxidase subunit 6b-1 [Chondrus crispus]|eukprot:XP_005715645.1 Cytochrome c oxidase subunit 6b-1 [Chondrus crispus]
MSEVTIQVRTAPRDRRFPTTNQTKHCWARYLEFHACSKVKGDDDPECEKFKRWYLSLCPEEWVENWDTLKEEGRFPGPE